MSLTPVKVYKLWNRVNDRFGPEEEDDKDKGKRKKANPKVVLAEKENKRIDKGLFKLRRIAKSDMTQESNVAKFEKTKEKTVKSMKKYCKMLKGDALRDEVQDLTKFRKAMKQLTIVVEDLEPKTDQEDEEGQADLNLLNNVDVAQLDQAMEDPNFGEYSEEELAGLETEEEEEEEQEEAPSKHPVQERFEALNKGYDAALAKNGPDVTRMRMLFQAIVGLLRNNDFVQGERVLDELEGLVARALGSKPPSAEDRRRMALFAARLKSLQPAIKRALTVPAPEVQALKSRITLANSQAKANDFDEAQATLDQVEELIKQILRNIPKAPPKPVDKEAEELQQRIKELLSHVGEAKKKKPEIAGDLKAHFQDAQACARERDYAGGHAALDKASDLLEQALNEEIPEAPPQPQKDSADSFDKRLKALLTQAAAASKANPDLGKQLKLLFSEAQVFQRKKDLARANGLLNQAEKLIKQATPPKPVADAGAWEKALAAAEPRYLQALRDNAGDVGKMKALFAFAQQQAEKEKFESAVQTLGKLNDLLNTAKNGASPSDVPKGLVNYRKALIGFGAAVRTVKTQLAAFRGKLASTLPEEAEVADELADQINGLSSELQDSVDTAMNAAQTEREPYSAATKAMIRTLVDRIKTNPLVKHVDENPFIATTVEDTLTAALANIEKTMV